MNLDELRAVQSKERGTDSLQHLRESFYADAADYVADLERRRDERARAADDPFADPEVRRLADEVETAREVVEAIYERRLGKLVKRASLAAADMPADEDGLTTEERALFEDLVDRIETNKSRVLDVLDGEADAGGESTPVADPGVGAAGGPASAGESAVDAAETSTPVADRSVDAADGSASVGGPASAGDPAADESASGDEPASADEPAADESRASARAVDDASSTPAAGDVDRSGTAREPHPEPDGGAAVGPPGASTDPDSTAGPDPADATEPEAGGATGSSGEAGANAGGSQPRTTVRVTGEVDEFFGVDARTYDLDPETVVNLPEENAEPLLRAGDAERVE